MEVDLKKSAGKSEKADGARCYPYSHGFLPAPHPLPWNESGWNTLCPTRRTLRRVTVTAGGERGCCVLTAPVGLAAGPLVESEGDWGQNQGNERKAVGKPGRALLGGDARVTRGQAGASLHTWAHARRVLVHMCTDAGTRPSAEYVRFLLTRVHDSWWPEGPESLGQRFVTFFHYDAPRRWHR